MANGHTHPWMEIKYTIILCILPAVISLSNMYQQKAAAYSSGAYGKTCYNLSEYTPKCGWKTIIKSPVPLNLVEFSDQSVEQLDNYTFITTNGEWSGDMTGKTQGYCSDFHYTGSFGSTTPSLFVAWYCICDASTNKACKVVYEENTTSNATSSTLQTQQLSTTTTVIQSSTIDSFTSISASSTPASFSTERSSNIEVSIDRSEGTPHMSKSSVDITTGINPSVIYNNPITINQLSFVSATNEDIGSTKSAYSSSTDQSLLINPTTDAAYTSAATTSDLYRSLVTSGTPSVVTNATSSIISSSIENGHRDVATINTLSTSESITASSTITSTSNIMKASSIDTTNDENVATANIFSTTVQITASTTITTATSNIINPSSIDAGHENVATANTIFSSMRITTSSTKPAIPTNNMNPTSVSSTNDSKFPSTDKFLLTQSDTRVKATVSTAPPQSTIVSHNSLTTFSYLTSSPTAPSAPTTTSIPGILPSLFTSLTTIYGSGSVEPTNPTSSTRFYIPSHLPLTKISINTHSAVIGTSGLTSQFLFAPLSMHTSSLESAWETALTSTSVPLLSIISPSLAFAPTDVTPESTPTTVLTTMRVSSSVYTGDEASTSSTVSLLATTTDKPVETKPPWSIHLSKNANFCYTGQNLTTITSVRHLLDCAASCIRDTTCNGVNFRKSTKRCDLVNDERISSTWQMSLIVDCSFWEMVWKQ